MNSPKETDQAFASNESTEALTGHEYDGIQEYDNPLPGWWKWLFVATIIFSGPYFAYYHFGNTSRSVAAQFEVAEAENMRLQFAEIGELKPDAPTLVKFSNDDRWVLFGQSVFKQHCVACHGQQAEGGVGPNLTDEHFKNIRNIEDILRVINNGAGAGAMPAWQNRLDENERILVSAYVASLRGTNVEGGKTPDGQLIDPWPSLEEIQAEGGQEESTAEKSGDSEQTEEPVPADEPSVPETNPQAE